MKKYLPILLIFFCSCANYKYNRGVAQRNEITDAYVHNEPIKEKITVWEYITVIGVFAICVWKISRIGI